MSLESSVICCDLDGTLLTSSKGITPYTREVIAEARARGCRFCLASGRSPGVIRAYHKMLGLDTPVIAHSGAVVWLPNDGRVLSERRLPQKPALDYIDFCIEEDLDWKLFTFDAVYYPSREGRHGFYEDYNALARKYGVPEFAYHDGLTRDQAAELVAHDAFRISVVNPTERQRSVLEAHAAAHAEMTFVYSMRTSFDAFPLEVNKWQGALKLCDYFGIDASEVVAFGNDENDIEMIRNAGHGFIVENSDSKLLACQATVIGSNDADGVAHAIRSFVLQEQ
jgi:Cof subfamily protein (haloacid dehalogenase superfamily)